MLYRNRTPTPEIICELTEIRMAWKLSIKDVTLRSKFTNGHHLREIEMGYRDVRFRNLIKWADALGYEITLKPK